LTNGATRTSGDADRELNGGGIFCELTSVSISNCIFVQNSASTSGGGAYGGAVRDSTFKNCTATGFGSDGGGAIWAVLNNCTFLTNSSTGRGGGAASCTAAACVFTANASQTGG